MAPRANARRLADAGAQAREPGRDLGLDITGRFPPIARAVGTLAAASIILDGELVALD